MSSLLICLMKSTKHNNAEITDKHYLHDCDIDLLKSFVLDYVEKVRIFYRIVSYHLISISHIVYKKTTTQIRHSFDLNDSF